MSARVDLEYASNVLVDAIALGDTSAAKKWGLNRRTIQRYRVHSREWPELAEMVRQKNAEVTHDLATLRVQFLRDALQELRKKLPEGSIYEVTGAIKIVGELHQTAMMVDDERFDAPSQEATETAGGVASDPAEPLDDRGARH